MLSGVIQKVGPQHLTYLVIDKKHHVGLNQV